MPEHDIDGESQPSLGWKLGTEQEHTLLQIARQTIERAARSERNPIFQVEDEALLRPAAVFVTLWRDGGGKTGSAGEMQLRGCIGRIQHDMPLYQAVQHAAMSAATRDPRFTPVQPSEVEALTIEIAILSPLREVEKLEEIKIGRDGIVIEGPGKRGLLLPKVATRLDWDRAQFLSAVCHKAGLPDDAWPNSSRLFRFETIEIRE